MGCIYERKDINAVINGFETSIGEIKGKIEDIKSRMPRFFDEFSMSEEQSTDTKGIKSDDDATVEDNNKESSVDVVHSSDDVSESDNPEDKTKEFVDRLMEILTSSEEIEKLVEQNPDLKVRLEKCLDILNNPDKHTAAEINWALDRIKKEIKGAILETAVKDALTSIGLDVEDAQRTVEGEDGATRPDVIATNNTDRPIILFGKVVNPGGNVYVECKCGRKEYMEGQLKNHLPNQLSGHDGLSILVTTSDMDEVDLDLLNEVIGKNDTTVLITETSAENIEEAIKEVD